MNERKNKNDHFIITHQPFPIAVFWKLIPSDDISWDVVRNKRSSECIYLPPFPLYSTALNVL